MKSVDILKEELEKKGLVAGEIVALKLYEALKASATRMSLESEEAAVKSLAPILVIVLNALEPQVKELIDFNKNKVVGE
jgi:hypothetical protein